MQRDPAANKLAGFAVEIAHRLHGSAESPPAFMWFEADGKSNGLAPAFPSVKGYYVRFASDLRGSDLVRVALHEVRHLHQAETLDLEIRERDAETFAAQWTQHVLGAFKAAGGSTRKLHVAPERRPPFYGGGRRWRSGDLVFSSAGRVWRYSATNHNAWMAL